MLGSVGSIRGDWDGKGSFLSLFFDDCLGTELDLLIWSDINDPVGTVDGGVEDTFDIDGAFSGFIFL